MMFKHIFCRHMLVYWANSLSKDDLHRNMKIFICQKLSTLAPIQDVCNSNIWIQRILYTQRNANEERSTGSMSPALLCNPIESNQLFAGQLLLEVRWGSSPPPPSPNKICCCTILKCVHQHTHTEVRYNKFIFSRALLSHLMSMI